jgi:hypothetical protein
MIKLVFASHGATQAPSACAQGAQKGLQATNRAHSLRTRMSGRVSACHINLRHTLGAYVQPHPLNDVS